MKKATLTNKQAYQALTAANVHWDRKDAKHIVVFTSGYKCANCHNIEKYLMQAGMRIVSQEFDRMSGKTFSVYKHK